MKKLLSLVLAVVMLFSVMNFFAFADGYTVTYYNGSSTVGNSATVIEGGSYTLDRVVENTDTQYFAGWYLDSGFKTQAKSTITVNANTNLYAKMVDYSSNLTIEAKSGSLFTDGGWASPKHYLRDTYFTYYNLIGAYGVADGKYYDLMPEGQHHRHAGGTDSGNSYETVDGVIVEKMEHAAGSYWANYGTGNGEYILRQPDGEAFMVKPNTTYNVTLTYKYLKTVDDASHYTKYWLSTGLSNSYPMYSGELNLNDETNTTSNSRGKFNDIANRTFAVTTKSDLVLVDKVTDEWTTMTMTITTPSLETYKNGNYLQVLSLSTATTQDVKSLWKSVTVEEVLPESCSVTYMNGNDVIGKAENIVEGSSFTIDRAVANTDTHYFAGWYTDSALTQKAATKITVSEDVTLYAKMVPYASSMSISAAQWNYNYRETVSSWYPYHEAYFANYYGAYNGAYKDIIKLNTGTFAGYRTSSASRKVLAYGHSGGYNIGSTFVIMNANGEAFIPKPNTTYKVSVTYASDTTSSSMKIGTAWSLTDTTLKATGDYAFSGKDLNSSAYSIGGGISGNPAATSEAVAQINTNGATTTAEFIITTPSLAEYSGKLQALGLYGFNVKSALYGSPVSNNIFFIDSVSVEETVVDTSVDVVYMNGSSQVGETTTLEQGAEYAIDRAVANTDTHYFAGWYTDSALTQKAATKITVSEDVTLYAKMVPYASSMSVSGSAWKYNYREQVNGWWPHNEIYYGNYYAVSGGAYKDILKVAGGTFAAYGTVNGSKVLSYGHNNDYGIASSYVIMDANGEIFVPKPNTTYKVSVKYYSNTTSSNMKVGTAWPIADTTLKATGDYAFTSAVNGYEYTTSSPTIGGGIGSTSPAVSSEAVAQVVTSEPTVAQFTITTPSLEDYNGKLQALGLYGFNVKGARNNYGFYISEVSIEEYTPAYSVTYMNGSAQVGEAVTGLSENASYTIDRVVENTNTHYFAGWYLDPSFNTEAFSTITVDGEVTLYAKMVEYKKTLSVASSSNYWAGWVSPKHYLRDNYFEYRALVGAYGINNGKYGDLLSEGYAHRHSGGSGAGNTAIADSTGVRNETRDTTSGTWQYYTSGDYILRDANGNAFIVKPNTTYKVTLTYTFDISKNANGKATYFLGTGLDASKLMHSGEMVLNDVTGDRITSSDYSAYGFTDGSNLSFLYEGVKVALVPTADNKTVELYITTPSLNEYKNNNSLQVLSICDEQSSNTVTSWKSVVVEELDNILGDTFGHTAGKVASGIEDKHTYKVTVMYKATAATKIGFFTADADSVGTCGYVEGKNVSVYTTAVNNGTTATAVIYITVDKKGEMGDNLYLYVIDGSADFVVFDAKAEKITNANGGYLIGNAGVSMINTSDKTASQALRYYFTYDSTTASDIVINGKSYNIVERGFLYANGSNVGEDTIVSRSNIGKSIIGSHTNNFTKCWSVKQNTDGTLNIWFSSYVKDFDSENGTYNASKRLYVKGYIVVEIDGALFTLYTTETNCTVAEVAALNNFHNEGNFIPGESNLPLAVGNRSLVWNLEFNGEGDYNKITTDTTTMEPSANSKMLSVSPSRENIFIDNGNLTLRIKDNGEDAPVRYTTAKSLTTDGKMAFKYGYLEMRAKVPFTTAMFPSFWMQPDKRLLADDFKYYGEVDIFEVYGDAQNLSTTIMKWDHNYNPVAPYGSLVHEMGYRFGKPDEYREYQIYGMEWTPEYFKFYVNGVLTHTIRIDEEFNSQYPGMECFNDFYYLCWNNFAYEDALAEYWLGDDPDGDGYGEDHVDYVIDYVRLYQNKDTEEIVLY